MALHRYPALSPDHLAQMAYATADLAAEGTSMRRTQRQQAREALDRVADQTGAVVVPAPGAAGPCKCFRLRVTSGSVQCKW